LGSGGVPKVRDDSLENTTKVEDSQAKKWYDPDKL
jgi:hypothetical protein